MTRKTSVPPCMVMVWDGKVLLGIGMVRIAHTLMEWHG